MRMAVKDVLKSRKALNAVMAVLLVAALVFVVIVFVKSTGGRPADGRELAYDGLKVELGEAVAGYRSNHNGQLPVDGSTVTVDSSPYHIIDMCALVDGTNLQEVPDSCGAIWGGSNDNCDADGCPGCSVRYHYIWAVDTNGVVVSSCVGTECRAHGEDGFQNVWP
jgi:hypothetical protein